ncbi:insulinase family protein [Candidatus Wolfebacteria bacterium]|nr:insulinase family protein [Candidatus Wolfebacteria bacterium]
MNNFQKTTLDNGLRVILVPQPQSPAITVLILVEAGSKYETEDINGLSHFLEHMCFKGTEKRLKSIDIASELESIGAICNAFTSFEYTGYYAKSEPGHFDTILDVISDIYLNQVFNPEEINKEKGVIIEEINMSEDLPMSRVQELFTQLLYGDQPAGWDIRGRKEVIQKLTQDEFLKYRKEHYLAQSTIVVVAGKIDEKETLLKVQKAFEKIKTTGKKGKIKTQEKQDKPNIILKFKETDQTHLVLGVRAFDIFDERKYALEVLTEILGGGMSSRLFQKVREEMGAAYYVRANADLMSDHGFLSVSAGIDHAKIDDVIKAILEEFKGLASNPAAEKEIERAKEHLVGNMMLSLETSDALAGYYGGQEVITKKNITPDELARKIRAVTAEEIKNVAQNIFAENKLNLAIIGPFKDEERFFRLLSLG